MGEREDLEYVIQNEPVKFGAKLWMDVSPNAINFIERCLIKDPFKRMNAVQALEHEWIHECLVTKDKVALDKEIFKNMANYRGSS